MKGKLIWSVFWALIVVFVIVVTMVVIPPVNELLFGEENPTLLGYIFVISAGVIITGLGVTLLVLTAKAKAERRLKVFLLLAEASFVGFPIFGILHNAISGLIHFEEPFFFIIAAIVCPAGLLVGGIGSIVLAVKRKRRLGSGQSNATQDTP
jgi:hypothetical protein